MDSFNPSRLALARKSRGLTKRGLAEAAGMSVRILTYYENGHLEPSQAALNRLAETVAFPPDFFAAPDTDEPALSATSFRALSRLTARKRDQALATAQIAIDLAHWIEQRFHLPSPDIPRLTGTDAEIGADAVRDAWELGERPIHNMLHLLESRGVRIFSLIEACYEVDAFSFWQEATPYIFLNTMKTAERGRMDAAHELGHLVLHRGHVTPRGRQEEHEAQRFASAFLMPRRSVIALAPRNGRVADLESARKHWNVATANLAHRMHALDLLSDWQYRSIFIRLGEDGYRTRERIALERETSQVLEKVFTSLRAKHIGKADIARDLHITTRDLNGIVFGLLSHTAIDGTIAEYQRSSAHDPPDLRVLPD